MDSVSPQNNTDTTNGDGGAAGGGDENMEDGNCIL